MKLKLPSIAAPGLRLSPPPSLRLFLANIRRGEMTKSTSENRHWLISQDELESWLDDISNARTLISSVRFEGLLLYRPVAKSSEISWSAESHGSAFSGRPVLSSRKYFSLRLSECYLSKKSVRKFILLESFPEWETVVFGVPPCDARGVKLMDAVFFNKPVTLFTPSVRYYAYRGGMSKSWLNLLLHFRGGCP